MGEPTFIMGENICIWSNWQGINLHNLHKTHAAQNQKKKKKKLKKLGEGRPVLSVTMKKVAAEDVSATFEDQQKINKFAWDTNRITEVKEEIETKQNQKKYSKI